MSLDLLLIQPPLHLDRTDLGAEQVSPNIGIAYIAACQRERGRSVGVLDAQAERLGLGEILGRVRATSPRTIGISAMTYQIPSSVRLARALKREMPDVPVVLGGAHATANPERTLEEFPEFDAVIAGEGEDALGEFLDDRANGGPKGRPGVYVRDVSPEAARPERPKLADLDALPYPAFDLFDLKKYWPFYSRRWRMELPLSASRGCPFHCTFCTKVMGDHARYRSPEGLVGEVVAHRKIYGVEQMIFTDENFTHKRSLVEGFCEGVIREGLAGKIRFICQSRVQVAPATIRLMARAGFTHITFGIESGDQAILDGVCKSIRLEDTRRAVEESKKAGMVVDGNFVLGLPNETEETIQRTIRFACELPLDYASFFLLVPYPGSRVLEMARKGEAHLRLLSDRWEDYGKQVGGAVELDTVSRRRLQTLQFYGYLRFYAHPKRWIGVFRKVSVSTVVSYLAMRIRDSLRPAA